MHIVTNSLQCAQVNCKKCCCLVFQRERKLTSKCHMLFYYFRNKKQNGPKTLKQSLCLMTIIMIPKNCCIKYHEEILSFSGNRESPKMLPKIPKYSIKEMATYLSFFCHVNILDPIIISGPVL